MTRPGLGNRDHHEPARYTVESESGVGVEWQVGTCAHCAERIFRFRMLSTGQWFDQWGSVAEC